MLGLTVLSRHPSTWERQVEQYPAPPFESWGIQTDPEHISSSLKSYESHVQATRGSNETARTQALSGQSATPKRGHLRLEGSGFAGGSLPA